MKVAMLVDDPGTSHDTYSLIAASLIPRLLSRGRRVIILRSRQAGSIPFRSTLHGVPCYSLGLWGSPLHKVLAPIQMAWILKKERVDLVHVHFSGVDGWGFSLCQLLAGIPFLLTFHGFNAGRLRARGRHHPLILGLLLSRAKGVTAVCRALKKALGLAYPAVEGRIEVVPNGLDHAHGAPRLERRPPGRFILSVGTLYFEKGTDLLLFAFHDLLGRLPEDVHLALCGRDESRGLFRDMARRLGLEGRVHFLGPLPHGEVLSLMRECLFYVCPSREEFFATAVLEARACGRAVVAPRIGGVSENLRHGVDGLLFEPDRAESLAQAIEELAGDPELRASLERQASESAGKFLWSDAAASYDGLQRAALAP